MAPSFAILCLLGLLAAVSDAAVTGAKWHSIAAAGEHPAAEETSMASCGGASLCMLGGRNAFRTPMLDTKELKWSVGAAPPKELHHFQAVTGPDGCAWIIGAWTGPFPGEKVVPEIYRYCAGGKEWEIVGKIDRPRGAGGVVFHDGFFYLVTGNVGGHRLEAKTVTWFDRYDPKTKKWTILPDIPHPRDHVNTVVAGGKLYVAGGRDSGAANYPDFFTLVEKKVDVFDFKTNKWSTLTTPFPRPRAGAPVVVWKGKPLVAGGEGSGRAWSEVDTLSGDKFVPFAKMMRPRHGFGMVACSGVLWTAGGAGTQGGGKSQLVLDAYYEGKRPAPCNFVLAKPGKSPVGPPVLPPSGNGTDPTPVGESPAPGESPGPDTPNDPDGVAGEQPGPEESKEPSVPDCFPAHATVRLADGSEKPMHLLSIGDRVLVSHPNTFSEVYFFSHQHPEHVSNFVRIATSVDSIQLTLSPGHMLYVNGRLTPARNVRVGDALSVAHEQKSAVVTSVDRTTSRGLFNPHTLHGDIVVDRVHTSTLTDALRPRVANVLLKPFATLYSVMGVHPSVRMLNEGVLGALDRFYWK